MTAVISNRLSEYLYNNDIMPKEQKGCSPGKGSTYELNKLNCGYQMKNENVKVSNLLYMDDLKIFGKNEQELRKEMKVIQIYSTDISMEMGLEKCAKVTFKRGERVKSEGIEVGDSDLIKELGENETYKYLGMNETRGIDETQVKDKLQREYIRRVRKVLKSELNSRNKSEENDKYVGLIKRVDQDLPTGQSIMKIARKISKEIQIEERGNETEENTKNKIKNKILEQIKNKWVEKQMHGQYPRAVQEHLIDNGYGKENLKAKQKVSLWQRKIRQSTLDTINVNSKCRLCEEHEETTEHIIAGCTILAKHEYIKRHDQVCRNLHYIICKEMVSRWEKNGMSITHSQ
ncbi:hypothetical protein ILUMI_27306 [Ignelater luminosus]|uniref:Reverse transcriptase domain-containing protein n=1 Tax=Ignelater luminosus TaxID=2038154 RepID=A0A8K0FY34_IGNLU|nr:hypothetical protein ILUMI_27306 [Ignelater luminosus]